jgi:Xaa-Pro aminopeptidase
MLTSCACQAVFEYETRRMGAVRMAYPPVVAGGASGNIIHYSRNDKTVPHGELVTMDAGGELHGYVSDITRSWPVSGKFTSAQLDVYEAVLSVHQSCLEGNIVPSRKNTTI